MKKVILAAALMLVFALFLAGTAVAQTQQYGTEVCVNASNADEAKRLFPNATIHILPDFPDPLMNGWRIVTGPVDPNGRVMTDSQEIARRQHERSSRRGWGSSND